MKYLRFIALGLGLIFLLFYFSIGYKNDRIKLQTQQEQITNQTQWETKTDEQEPILIKVTPLQLGAGQDSWRFEVDFTTHSIDLDMDVAKVVSLVDDKGNDFLPISWEGPGPGGHHISGNLIFNAITPMPKFVELKIKEVGGISERSFRWDIQ